MHFDKFIWKLQTTMQFGVRTLACGVLFKILEKRLVVLLYWFVAKQQINTFKHEKYASFYSKCNAHLDECSPNFPKQQEVA